MKKAQNVGPAAEPVFASRSQVPCPDATRQVQQCKVGYEHADPVEHGNIGRTAFSVTSGSADEFVGVIIEI
jgi:hypothetical protein